MLLPLLTVPPTGSPVTSRSPPKRTPPAKEPEPKLEDVRAVLADMSRKGHTAEIRALLQKYGAAKLGVDPANYSALLKDVEGLDHAD